MAIPPLSTNSTPDIFDALSDKLIDEQKESFTTPPNSPSRKENALPKTPETFRFCSMPPTPSAKRTQTLPTVIFSGELPLTNDPQSPFTNFSHPIKDANFLNVYTLPGENTPRVVMKQPGRKDCGPTSLLMLWADKIKASGEAPISLSDEFWKCMSGCYGMSWNTMIDTGKNHLGLDLEDKKISSICDVEALIDGSKKSVIVSIEHPEIFGHWIVIDKVIDDTVYIRDPYGGKPHAISRDEADVWFSDGTGLCLSHQ